MYKGFPDAECVSSNIADNSLGLFRYSLQNPGPIMDQDYAQGLPLDEEYDHLADNVWRLLERLDSAVSEEERLEIAREIWSLLVKNDRLAAYLPFLAFWKVKDVSFSALQVLLGKGAITEDEVEKTIVELWMEYKKSRLNELARLSRESWRVIGQALRDYGASRGQGNSAARKLAKIICRIFGEADCGHVGLTNEFSKLVGREVKVAVSFIDSDVGPLDACIKQMGAMGSYNDLLVSFARYLRHPRIKSFAEDLANTKRPDFIIRIGYRILIGEAKHIKEPGGSQNNSLRELRDFIGQPPEQIKIAGDTYCVHYVSYLDGTYERLLAKLNAQRKAIEDKLKGIGKGNFYVNAAGFEELLRLLAKGC